LLVSLVQFDNEIETVFTAVEASRVAQIRIEPRGSTSLLDALGETIDATGRRLSQLPEHERPGCVVIAVVTDGEENSSRTFSLADVRTRVRHQAEVYSWQFVFLGAHLNAVEAATAMGIEHDKMLSVLPDDEEAIAHAIGSLRGSLTSSRNATAAGAAGSMSFTQKDRDLQTPKAPARKRRPR
jgi:uncharacterized protein YegL